jgi:diguanylate cyclase (GGDEF)-like protein/PAS domain S-box-containing protein
MNIDAIAAALVSSIVSCALLWRWLRASARKELDDRTARLFAVVNAAPDGVLVSDARNQVVFVNDRLLELSGYERSELVGERVEKLVPDRHRELHARQSAAFLGNPHVRLMGEARDIVLLRKAGSEIPVEISLSPMRIDGTVLMVAIVRDVSKQRAMAERVKRLAFYDAVTNLPNRNHFQRRLQRSLDVAQGRGLSIAVLLVDLDGFKQINDVHGHDAGDQVLRVAAERMVASLRPGDGPSRATSEGVRSSISRLGGDEFIVLLCGVRGPGDAVVVAERLISRLSEPIRLDGGEAGVGASIGIALYPKDGADAETLLKRADAAMYQAKASGGRCCRFFSADLEAAMMRSRKIAQRLGPALERNELRVHYQPLKNARTGKLTGAEALLRWHDVELGSVNPAEVIAVAEDSDLILRVDEWVLRTVCRQIRAWREAGYRAGPISVNISPKQLRVPGYAIEVENVLRAENLSPCDLRLELTETAVLDEGPATVANLSELRQLGVGLVLDDFGTGFSSLTNLARLPITGLKIDRTFVARALEDERSAAVVSCLVELGRRLGLSVTAEGVESELQLRFLVANGCEDLQGFLWSPAVPPETFAGWLAGERLAAA